MTDKFEEKARLIMQPLTKFTSQEMSMEDLCRLGESVTAALRTVHDEAIEEALGVIGQRIDECDSEVYGVLVKTHNRVFELLLTKSDMTR